MAEYLFDAKTGKFHKQNEEFILLSSSRFYWFMKELELEITEDLIAEEQLKDEPAPSEMDDELHF